MSGLGAWYYGFYEQGMDYTPDRVKAGIKAFKHALIDNGYSTGIDLSFAGFGSKVKRQVIAFQKAEGITADGVIGPETARYLFRYYSYAAELSGTIEIPDHLLQKVGCEESEHDPAAQGYDDIHDEGWGQISLSNHPDITQEEAWTPSFAIPWSGRYLQTFFVNEAPDFDGAVASYNVGTTYAKMWVEAGKPNSGLIINLNGNLVDIYTRASGYVARVKVMPV